MQNFDIPDELPPSLDTNFDTDVFFHTDESLQIQEQQAPLQGTEVSRWLQSKGFAQYIPLFVANNYVKMKDVLLQIQEDDLEKLGVKAMCDRKTLISEIGKERDLSGIRLDPHCSGSSGLPVASQFQPDSPQSASFASTSSSSSYEARTLTTIEEVSKQLHLISHTSAQLLAFSANPSPPSDQIPDSEILIAPTMDPIVQGGSNKREFKYSPEVIVKLDLEKLHQRYQQGLSENDALPFERFKSLILGSGTIRTELIILENQGAGRRPSTNKKKKHPAGPQKLKESNSNTFLESIIKLKIKASFMKGVLLFSLMVNNAPLFPISVFTNPFQTGSHATIAKARQSPSPMIVAVSSSAPPPSTSPLVSSPPHSFSASSSSSTSPRAVNSINSNSNENNLIAATHDHPSELREHFDNEKDKNILPHENQENPLPGFYDYRLTKIDPNSGSKDGGIKVDISIDFDQEQVGVDLNTTLIVFSRQDELYVVRPSRLTPNFIITHTPQVVNSGQYEVSIQFNGRIVQGVSFLYIDENEKRMSNRIAEEDNLDFETGPSNKKLRREFDNEDNGSSSDIVDMNAWINTYAMRSAAIGQLDFVKFFVEKNLITANAQDITGSTMLHWACAYGHDGVAEYLLSKGVPFSETKNNFDVSPLDIAAKV